MARLLKFLKEAAEVQKPVTIDSLLREHFSQPGRPPTAGRFYPSSLDGVCSRAAALQFIGAPASPVTHDTALQLIFEVGHGVHDRLQKALEVVAAARGMTFTPEIAIPPQTNPWFVSGRIDGLLVQGNYTSGVEFKTINAAQFNRLYSGPQEKHRFQANIYWGLYKPKLDAFSVFYICKDNSLTKEFHLAYSPALFEEAMTKIEDILIALQREVLPPKVRPDCRDPKCAYRDACWNEASIQEALKSAATQERLAAFVPIYRNGI